MSKIEKLIQLIKESKQIVVYSTEYEHDEYGEFTGDETEWQRRYLMNTEQTKCRCTEYCSRAYSDEDPFWTETKKMTMTIDDTIDNIIGGWFHGYGFDARTTKIVFTKIDGTTETVDN